METPGFISAAQRHELTAIAGTYDANTNRIAFARPVRRMQIHANADSANKLLYMHVANQADATPETELGQAGSRYRFSVKTLANGGTVIDICFDFEVYYAYFLSSTGTIDAHVIGWEKP